MKTIQTLLRACTGERLFVLFFFLLLTVYTGATLQFREVMVEDVVGPRTFPIFIIVISFALVLAYVIKEIRGKSEDEDLPRGESAPPPQDSEADPPISYHLADHMGTMMPWVLIVAYALLLEPIGFIPATFLFVVSLMRLLGQPNWTGAMVHAVWLTAAIYGLFAGLLGVHLPAFGEPFQSLLMSIHHV